MLEVVSCFLNSKFWSFILFSSEMPWIQKIITSVTILNRWPSKVGELFNVWTQYTVMKSIKKVVESRSKEKKKFSPIT